ncbi:MAG: thiamine phosphate synthase [Verrucomicrobia bacterium]|nr:thiamine phosphate synthase [Verrucomicrobiota bacterium]
MKLIVISPEAVDAREHAVLARLFATGLDDYHLRKPAWDRNACAAYLRALPPEFRARVILHSHGDLAVEFAVRGLHERDEPKSENRPPHHDFRSRAVHDLPTLRASLDHYERLLVSPVFRSFSKPGRVPDARLEPAELKAALALPRRAEVIALGGIDASRLPACRDFGFDGVAVLGAIWQAADPVRAFNELQHALHSHAA